MKDIYVNKEGVICACTVEVPEKPIHPDKNYFEFPYLYDRALGEYSSLLRKYFEALQACKESAVPFEDQEAAYGILYTWNSPAVGGVYKPTPDTFYQIDCDWEIVEIMNHRSSPTAASVPLYKVARLKVPAPTVATDNSGERQIKAEEILQEELDKIGKGNTTQIQFCYKAIFNAMDRFSNCKSKSSRLEKEHDCEFFLVTDVAVYACECDPHHILIDNQEYIPVASPVEEDQESQPELFRQIVELFNHQHKLYGRADYQLLQERFKVTRKS